MGLITFPPSGAKKERHPPLPYAHAPQAQIPLSLKGGGNLSQPSELPCHKTAQKTQGFLPLPPALPFYPPSPPYTKLEW